MYLPGSHDNLVEKIFVVVFRELGGKSTGEHISMLYDFISKLLTNNFNLVVLETLLWFVRFGTAECAHKVGCGEAIGCRSSGTQKHTLL